MTDNKMLRISILSLLAILASAQDRCKSTGILTYGKCPEVDQDFSNDLYVKCVSLSKFGCVLKSSSIVPGKLVCTLDPKKVAADKICSGDRVIFDSIDIRRSNILSYSLDLNPTPILIDFYLLSDATRSMRGAMADVRQKFNIIIEQFKSEIPNVAFGVGYYIDSAISSLNNGFNNAMPITTDLKFSINAVNSLKAEYGDNGDYPEANLFALYRVATSSGIKWRKNSQRILVYFGDYPGHEPSCVDGKSLTRFNVGDALKKEKITVVGVTFGAKQLDGITKSFKCSGSNTRTGQATHITSVTGGTFEKASSDSAVIETIRSALKNLPRKYDVDESDCMSTITSTFSPKNPWLVLQSKSKTVKHTMEVKKRVCEVGGSFECKFKFSNFGGELLWTSVSFVNVKGCPKRR